MKNTYLKITLVLTTFILAISCSEDDLTGASTLTATAPSLSVALDFANNQSLVEMDASYNFTVTLSEPQIVDTRVYLSQTGGNATSGEDFAFPSSVTIPKGATSATDVIEIFADDLVEDTETVTILIGTGVEANVSSIGSQTVSFTISNLEEADLAVGLSWSTASIITDNFGNEIDAYDAADLRLLLTDVPYTNIIDSADGASAETVILDGSQPDGEYYIVADFFAASEIPVDLDLTLTFNQTGVINDQTHNFSAALNTTDACADLHVILAKITKTGSSYAFEEIGQKSSVDFSDFVGTWSGPASWSEIFGYTSEVVTTLDANGDLLINGLAFQWFQDWWSEVIVTNSPVRITSYDPCSGDFEIEEQFYITSTYLGDPQPEYSLSATGNISVSGGVVTMTVNPVFHQDGGTFNGPEFGGPAFLETLTLD